MGCASSKAGVSAVRLEDGPSSDPTPMLSVRNTPQASRGVPGPRSGSPATGALGTTPIILLPRSTGDSSIAQALRTKQRHCTIAQENSSLLSNPKRVVAKDPAVHAFLVRALQSNMFFGALSAGELADIANAMESEHVPTGTLLLKQGDPGDIMYAIESGRLEIIMGGLKQAEFGEGTPGLIVGELSVLFSSPRSASVRAVTNCRLWRIDRAAYRAIVSSGEESEHSTLKAALRRGILEKLEEEQLSKVASAAFRVRFAPHDQIIRKGEQGEVFYIIESGSVVCRDLPGEQRDNLLSAGDYFGERALTKKEARACNVFAGESGAGLIALHRDDFIHLLGHIKDLLEHNAVSALARARSFFLPRRPLH